MLRACHRVLKPGGRLVFFAIAAAGGLTPAQMERALEVGHVDAGPGYASLLDTAGFEDVTVTDVTDAYLATLAHWYQAYDLEAAALRALIGSDDYAERQTRRRRTIEAVDNGLMRRYLVAGQRPDAEPTAEVLPHP